VKKKEVLTAQFISARKLVLYIYTCLGPQQRFDIIGRYNNLSLSPMLLSL